MIIPQKDEKWRFTTHVQFPCLLSMCNLHENAKLNLACFSTMKNISCISPFPIYLSHKYWSIRVDIDVRWMLTPILSLTILFLAVLIPVTNIKNHQTRTRAYFLHHIFIWGKSRKMVGGAISWMLCERPWFECFMMMKMAFHLQ